MKITDLRCAVLGENPVVRVVTDEGISGYGEIESFKPYLKPTSSTSDRPSSARTRPTSSG